MTVLAVRFAHAMQAVVGDINYPILDNTGFSVDIRFFPKIARERKTLDDILRSRRFKKLKKSCLNSPIGCH